VAERETVQIPLTIYKRGVRTVIGMVQVEKDGQIKGQVAKDRWPEVESYFNPNVGELSIGPFTPSRTPEAVVVKDPRV
jgi:hypothetical protein